MLKTFGKKTAGKLKLRLGVMRQAKCLDDVPKDIPDRCHQLTGNHDERFAVILHDNKRLVFEPDHDPMPRKEDGGIDLTKVTTVKFRGVVDYHGN